MKYEVQKIDGEFYVVEFKKQHLVSGAVNYIAKPLSAPCETCAEAQEVMQDYLEDEANERDYRDSNMDTPEDTPCLQPEDFMQFHS